ncbi:MAG: SseB family protein [Pseudorhodobacter sp.]
MTPLDQAHAAMCAASDRPAEDPGDDAARLRYFAALADSELVLLLTGEAAGSEITPRIFDLEEGRVVLAYDGEERLAEAAGGPAAYAVLPGRVIARQLAGQGIGLGVNLGAGTGAFLLDPEAVGWLAQTLDHAPMEAEARAQAFVPPGGLPDALMQALDGKLARAAGLARAVLIAGVRYEDGRQGHMLAFLDAVPSARTALARAAGEALTFSGIEAGEIDVTFLASGNPAVAMMARVGVRIDLPEPVGPPTEPAAPKAPGTDPERPPRLR